jgi:hypothetical protein
LASRRRAGWRRETFVRETQSWRGGTVALRLGVKNAMWVSRPPYTAEARRASTECPTV